MLSEFCEKNDLLPTSSAEWLIDIQLMLVTISVVCVVFEIYYYVPFEWLVKVIGHTHSESMRRYPTHAISNYSTRIDSKPLRNIISLAELFPGAGAAGRRAKNEIYLRWLLCTGGILRVQKLRRITCRRGLYVTMPPSIARRNSR